MRSIDCRNGPRSNGGPRPRPTTSRSRSRPAGSSRTSSAWLIPRSPSPGCSSGPVAWVASSDPSCCSCHLELADRAGPPGPGPGAIPPGQRVAVEFRHPSWFVDECRSVLERHGAALCLVDRRGPRPPIWRTAEWGYVRFHEGTGRPWPCYRPASLASWVEQMVELWPEATSDTIYAYFNNDTGASAVRDAHQLALAAGRAGVPASRTPMSPRRRSDTGQRDTHASGVEGPCVDPYRNRQRSERRV